MRIRNNVRLVLRLDKVWMSIYMFLFIFQPPFFKVNLIYFLGSFTFLLLLYKPKTTGRIFVSSGMTGFYKIILMLALGMLLTSVIDYCLITKVFVLSGRIHSLNQLVILTGLELICVCYILERSEVCGYSIDDIFRFIAIAGIIQGCCTLMALLSPTLRDYFLQFQTWANEWHRERRGYGFSASLVDNFGFGIGLIAGVALLGNGSKRDKLVTIGLCFISGVLNARTSIVVFAIALFAFLVFKDNRTVALRLVIAFILIIILYKYFLPQFVVKLYGIDSNNARWIASGIDEVLSLVSTRDRIDNVSFLSDLSHLPSNMFIWLFGTGHNVYGLSSIIGFHSDSGYINSIWEFGLIGTIILFYGLYMIARKAFFKNRTYSSIVIFISISYLIVTLKCILIGCNPGTIVAYIVLFSIIYFGNNNESIIHA